MAKKEKIKLQSSILSKGMLKEYDNGMTIPEISNIFQETEGSVRRRLRGYLEHLKRHIPEDIRHRITYH